MVRTVVQRCLHVDNLIAGNDSACQRFYNPFFNRRNESSGHNAADNSILKFKSGAALRRFDFQMNVSVLSASPRLFFMFILGIGNDAFDRFFVRNARFNNVDVHAEFFLKPFYDDREMQFTLSLNHRLLCLGVVMNDERGVFLMERMEAGTDLILFTFRLRENGICDHRVGKEYRRIHNGESFRTQGVIGMGILQLHDRS